MSPQKAPRAVARVVTIALIFAWLTLELRHMFQGEIIVAWRGASDAEWYSYSALWLVFGLILPLFNANLLGIVRFWAGLEIPQTIGRVIARVFGM